ncbi:MAG: GrpB family protein [archaeon]
MSDILKRAVAEKYLFNKYSSSYPKLFAAQKRFISKVLSSVPKKEIHHIGSTSVPNLGGKKVLDVLVIVEKKHFSKSKKLLHNFGYEYDHTMAGKRHFHKKYYVDYLGVPRLVHLHLTYFGSGAKEVALAFREYLKHHKKTRVEYAKIKREASKRYSFEGKKYSKHKLSFLKSTLKKALKWYKQQ